MIVDEEPSDGIAISAALGNLALEVTRQRKAQGLTQEETAYRANVAVRTLQGVESGKLNPRYLTLRAIALALGTTVSELV